MKYKVKWIEEHMGITRNMIRRYEKKGVILRNEKGTLSKVLSLVSVKQVNVLAINQTIPINGIANVALTLDISDLEISIQSLVSLIEAMPMVEKADLVAVE